MAAALAAAAIAASTCDVVKAFNVDGQQRRGRDGSGIVRAAVWRVCGEGGGDRGGCAAAATAAMAEMAAVTSVI